MKYCVLDTQIEINPFSSDFFTLAHIYIDVNIALSFKKNLEFNCQYNVCIATDHILAFGSIVVTAHQRSCRKVMYSQASVSHSVHRGRVGG